MAEDSAYRRAVASAVALRQEDRSVASSGIAAPFAEADQDADEAAVRGLFGARPPGSDRSGRGERRPAGTSSALPAQYEEASQSVEQAAVRPMLGASPEPELTGTGFTYRHNWGARRGQWTLRLNWGAVNARSRVLVSVGEGTAGGPDAGKFVGAARYTVHNVAPRAGGVDIWVNIEWSSDILLFVDYLVVNP